MQQSNHHSTQEISNQWVARCIQRHSQLLQPQVNPKTHHVNEGSVLLVAAVQPKLATQVAQDGLDVQQLSWVNTSLWRWVQEYLYKESVLANLCNALTLPQPSCLCSHRLLSKHMQSRICVQQGTLFIHRTHRHPRSTCDARSHASACTGRVIGRVTGQVTGRVKGIAQLPHWCSFNFLCQPQPTPRAPSTHHGLHNVNLSIALINVPWQLPARHGLQKQHIKVAPGGSVWDSLARKAVNL